MVPYVCVCVHTHTTLYDGFRVRIDQKRGCFQTNNCNYVFCFLLFYFPMYNIHCCAFALILLPSHSVILLIAALWFLCVDHGRRTSNGTKQTTTTLSYKVTRCCNTSSQLFGHALASDIQVSINVILVGFQCGCKKSTIHFCCSTELRERQPKNEHNF